MQQKKSQNEKTDIKRRTKRQQQMRKMATKKVDEKATKSVKKCHKEETTEK